MKIMVQPCVNHFKNLKVIQVDPKKNTRFQNYNGDHIGNGTHLGEPHM